MVNETNLGFSKTNVSTTGLGFSPLATRSAALADPARGAILLQL